MYIDSLKLFKRSKSGEIYPVNPFDNRLAQYAIKHNKALCAAKHLVAAAQSEHWKSPIWLDILGDFTCDSKKRPVPMV